MRSIRLLAAVPKPDISDEALLGFLPDGVELSRAVRGHWFVDSAEGYRRPVRSADARREFDELTFGALTRLGSHESPPKS